MAILYRHGGICNSSKYRLVLVLAHPLLVGKVILASQRLQRRLAQGIHEAHDRVGRVLSQMSLGFPKTLRLNVRGLLPGAQLLPVLEVQKHAHAAGRRDEATERHDPQRAGYEAPEPRPVHDDEDDVEGQGFEKHKCVGASNEKHEGPVGIANAPVDEVGVQLPAKHGFGADEGWEES